MDEERPDDHLRDSLDRGVEGAYTPFGFHLRGGGVDSTADAVAHVHEAHHGALNDSTAWGTALHLTARLSDRRDTFLWMLDACRRVHEGFATWASVAIVGQSRRTDQAFARYRLYIPMLRAVDRFVEPVDSPMRRYLLVTQVARACMQTPILDQLTRDREVSRRGLRVLDTPDGRWAWYLRNAPHVAGQAALAADEAVGHLPSGSVALDLDRSGAGDTNAAAHDSVWNAWERTAYSSLAHALARAGGDVLDFDGHQAPTRQAVTWAKAHDPHVRLAAALDGGPARDDRTLAAATLEQATHNVAPTPWSAACITLPPSALADELRSRIYDGDPLILDARPRERLRSLYQWVDGSLDGLGPHPLVAVRVCDGDAVLHHIVSSPDDLDELVAAFRGAELVATCVSVSCLADRDWQTAWLAPLRRAGFLVFVIDVELDRFLKNWADADVGVFGIEINDTLGTRYAAAARVDRSADLWIAIGDELTANLVLRQISDTPGLNVTNHGPLEASLNQLVTAVLTHLLATESYFDLGGLMRNP